MLKVGRHLERAREALAAARMLDGAVLVENVTLAQQRVRPLDGVSEPQVPYFSLIIASRRLDITDRRRAECQLAAIKVGKLDDDRKAQSRAGLGLVQAAAAPRDLLALLRRKSGPVIVYCWDHA